MDVWVQENLPYEVNLESKFTRNIVINTPIISAFLYYIPISKSISNLLLIWKFLSYLLLETQEVVGLKKLFWLYFPECRKVFNNSFVYNPDNDAQRMSFDDLFRKREFSSFVEKESNVFDRSVSPNWTGIDALLESERIREEIFTFEHDLWHF